jgi:hypothetical protein
VDEPPDLDGIVLVEPGGNERSVETRSGRETPQLMFVERAKLREHQAMQSSGWPLSGCEQLGFTDCEPERDGSRLLAQ